MTELPDILPVFPLTGVLLLPSTRLPLHVFEPRYRAMVEDAVAGSSPIGLIQPLVPADDNQAPAPAEGEGAVAPPALYRVGCAGTIENAQRLDDGRWVILLKGLRRFRIREELPSYRGYRRVLADWSPFGHDGAEVLEEDATARLLSGLERYGRVRSLDLDLEALSELPGAALLHGVSAALPFLPVERQALLEAETVDARLGLLLDLLAMETAVGPTPSSERQTPPN